MLKVPASNLLRIENKNYIKLGNRNIPVFYGSRVLELGCDLSDNLELNIVVLGEFSNTFGLIVDKLLGETELVVRPLDQRLGKVPCVSSASINDEGQPVLILDIDDIASTVEKMNAKTINSSAELSPVNIKNLEPKDILVVDDSPTVRETQRQILTNAGYRVTLAADGMDGWNTLRSKEFDLVVTDIDMPRLNGFQFLELIKKDLHLKSIPVIIVSYKDRKEDHDHGYSLGANAYLTKNSFKDDTFIQTIKDLLREK
jgi:two-component system sensor histidine kinase and response regulator WspE